MAINTLTSLRAAVNATLPRRLATAAQALPQRPMPRVLQSVFAPAQMPLFAHEAARRR